MSSGMTTVNACYLNHSYVAYVASTVSVRTLTEN